MTFIDRARKAAEQARQTATQSIGAMTTPEAKTEMREAAGQMGMQMRGVAGQAKRGLITAIEKIDPSVLAEIVIKATAIQEAANQSLRHKGSTYRISEITVTATIPPQIGFAISRIGDDDEEPIGTLLTSSELADTGAPDGDEVVTLEGDVLTDAVAPAPQPEPKPAPEPAV